ncbi:acyltransferase [Psychromonas sp. RZ22]|uniref:acyltransferase family protein n=1 Tax=Psychromonas algarum TaxID=2555643 RepID=UPI001067F52B|nr:acyltransferase family protein [Psychromonas sp. RZ22]TEW55673.1 acyltransferase [Psychromonas sp. RZ22]
MEFRKDINGLRALAVIAVVLFHFNPTLIPGGFAGVDVFFVISGFLMTSIIFRGIEQDNFSLIKFYIARANRIIPALTVLCFTLLLLGWFSTFDVVFAKMSEHILASISFISNFTYWQESGYFKAVAHQKWLLHTWSLSAEWQFYLIYPLLLVVMRKFLTLQAIKIAILIMVFVSFIASAILTYQWPDPSYYLLHTRAWEMLLGGVAYLYPIAIKTNTKKKVEYCGLLLIFTSYFLISQDNAWPGYLAIFPVLGTFLIIQAQSNHSFLSNNIIYQKIGTWSYSIYLWHWPLVVYMNAYMDINALNITLMIILSIILGMFSHLFIEQKLKGKKAVILWFITLGLSSIVYINAGHFEIREKSQDPGNQILSTYKKYKLDPTRLYNDCNTASQMNRTGKMRVAERCISSETGGLFLWGDSHVATISTGLRYEMKKGTPLSLLSSNSCAPSFVMKRPLPDNRDMGCNYSNEFAYKSILKSKPSTVIMATRFKHELFDWEDTINTLHKMGVEKVIVVGPLPQWQPSLPLVYARRHIGEEFIVDSGFDYSLIKSNQFLVDLHKKNKNFIFINMLDNLCSYTQNNELSCRAKVDDDLVAFDYGHLTVEASKFIAKNYVVPLL